MGGQNNNGRISDILNYIPEKQLKNQPEPITLEEWNIISQCVCQIKGENLNGTGFLCNIPYNDGLNSIKTLITCRHVLDENDIIKGKTIVFSINNKNFPILINESRKTYTSEKYDTTIIEITKEDGINKESFLEIDNQIFLDNYIKLFLGQNVYLFHYLNEKISFSSGAIKNINKEYIIEHLCNSSFGSSGGPLINNITYKVIGIHIGAPPGDFNWNYGILLKFPIEEFIKKITNSINKSSCNEIFDSKNIEKEKIVFDDEITIKYRVSNNQNIVKIFDEKFVKNNNKICKIVIKGNEKELCSNLEIKDINLKQNIFEVRLKGINNITNMSYMFNGCDSLLNIIDIENLKTDNVTDMSYMFSECKELKALPNISNFNTHNVINLKKYILFL